MNFTLFQRTWPYRMRVSSVKARFFSKLWCQLLWSEATAPSSTPGVLFWIHGSTRDELGLPRLQKWMQHIRNTRPTAPATIPPMAPGESRMPPPPSLLLLLFPLLTPSWPPLLELGVPEVPVEGKLGAVRLLGGRGGMVVGSSGPAPPICPKSGAEGRPELGPWLEGLSGPLPPPRPSPNRGERPATVIPRALVQHLIFWFGMN